MSTRTARSDDTITAGYQYSWSPDVTFSVQEFVAKYKPSTVQNDGTKPWLWVRREKIAESPSVESEAAAVVEAAALCEHFVFVTYTKLKSPEVQQVTERVEQIKNDASIPVRGNKKGGMQSKKEAREQVQTEAADKLKNISKKYGFVAGKWLIFAPSEKVDAIWSKIASSLVSGPLSSTSALCAKVATSPEDAVPGYQHVICVYIPDVYNKNDVTAVMKVLLRQHGLNLSGVKPDLYTTIGLDSKHPSGIPSTEVWRNVSLLKDSEIKELKEAYYTELSASKATTTFPAGSSKDSETARGKSKLLVKRKVAEDPFVSDDETDSKSGKLADVSGEGSNKSPVKRKKI